MEGRPLPAHLLNAAAASTSLVIPAASFGLNSSFSVVTRGNILSNNNKFVENSDNVLDNASGTHSVDRILYNEYKPTISPALLSVVEKVSSCENLHSIVAAAAASAQQPPQIHASQVLLPSGVVGGGGSLPMLNNLVQGIVAAPQTSSVVVDAVAAPCCSSDVGGNEDVYVGRPVSPLRSRGRPPINPGPDASTRQHNCPYCSKTFPNNSALLKHKLIHSDERRFICEICQKAFKRPDHLNGHLNVHKTVKPFPCVASSCDKSYCDARSLRRHLEHAHNIKNAIVQSSRGKVMVKCGDYHTVQVISKTSNAGGAATSSICSPSSAADQQMMGVGGGGGGCLSSTTSTSGGNRAINATSSTNSRESQESIDTISGRTSIIDPTALSFDASRNDLFCGDQSNDNEIHPSIINRNNLSEDVPCAQCGRLFRNSDLLSQHVRAIHSGQQRSSCAVIYNNSAALSVDLHPVHTYSNFQSICQAPDLSSPNSVTHFHSPSSSYAATASVNVGENRNNPIAATPPFYLENRQQSTTAVSSSYFDSQILLDGSRQQQLVNLQQTGGGVGGVCQMGHPVITGVNNLDQLIDLDLCKDVDDELINKELEYLYNNSNNMGGNFDPLATNSSVDGHHNPLDQFLRDSTSQFYDEEDEYYFSPERKRHLTAPGSLNFSSTNNRTNNYLITNNINNEPPSISTPKLMASGAGEFLSLTFDANNNGSGRNATASAIVENVSSNANQNRARHSEEAEFITTANNDRQNHHHHLPHRHIQKSKTRPTSRNRRKSRGKPDNVFALLNSVLAKKQLQLSISPVRFRKQKFAPVVDHRPARPAPLIIPGQNTFNKFHSQLRSPRLWVDPHSSSSSSGGLLDVGSLTSLFTPYTPPPILSPMRKGSGLFWRISVAACGGVSGAKSAPISPRCRREFWKKVTTPQKEAICGQTIAKIDPSDCLQSINDDGNALENGAEIPETDTNPHINVGSMYQAWIDDDDVRLFDRYADPTLHQADLMFDPFYAEDRDEDELNSYMEFACSNAIFGSAPNKEYAFHLLHCTRGDLEKSVVLLMDHRTAYTNFGNYTYIDSDSWSPEEIQQFQDALFKHDKDFFLVASTIGTKTVKQCVAFYYTWKKIYSDENRRLKSLRRRRDLSDVNNGAYYNLRTAAASAAATVTTTPAAVTTGEKSPDDVNYSRTNNVSKIVTVIEDHSPELKTNELTYQATPIATVSPSVTVHKKLNFDDDEQEIKMENEQISSIIEESDDQDLLLMTDDYSSPFKINDVSAEEIVEQTRPKRTNTNRDGYFPCRLCGKIFYKIKSRNAHMKSHSDKVPKKKKDN